VKLSLVLSTTQKKLERNFYQDIEPRHISMGCCAKDLYVLA
jgi:hypothetical protein